MTCDLGRLNVTRLLLVTVMTAFCADWRECHPLVPRRFSNTILSLLVVASIEETATRYHIPKMFIG